MNTDARGVAALDHAARGGIRSDVRRDARNTRTHQGASGIQRLAIARHDSGLR